MGLVTSDWDVTTFVDPSNHTIVAVSPFTDKAESHRDDFFLDGPTPSRRMRKSRQELLRYAGNPEVATTGPFHFRRRIPPHRPLVK
jgi:hypothetical protein